MKKNNAQRPPRPKFEKGKNPIARTFKMLVGFYPVLFPLAVVCIIFSAATSAIPALFQQEVLASIEKWFTTGNWEAAKEEIIPMIILLASLYLISIICITAQSQLMAYMTQGFLDKMRRKMFGGMQDLPIKYFDTNKHGDIMSHYTNDIDTLRQLVSQSIPALIQSGIIVTVVFSIMLYFSIWMTLLLVLGVFAMMLVSKKIGGGSAKYFVRQQKAMGKNEGFVQEMMNGQKVVKVFCHENDSQKDFDKINEQLYEDSFKAHAYANSLGPIIMNIGNIMYVLVAMVGGLFLLSGLPNLSLSGKVFSISILCLSLI